MRLLRGSPLPGLLLALVCVGQSSCSGPEPPVVEEPAFAGTLPAGVVERDGRYYGEQDGAELVYVPAGPFTMGSDAGAPDEAPAHVVQLGGYFIDRLEVTNAAFEAFVRSGYRPHGPWRKGYGAGEGALPVRYVTWHDAQAYARWVGRDLPTEAQWEKAARGEEGLRYPWGDEWQPGASASGRAVEAGPLAAGSVAAGASPSGALDMSGNVWEWTGDWYDRHHYATRPALSVVDPTGPADGAEPEERFQATETAGGNERSTRKVIRGGGWVAGGAENGRCAKRVAGNPRYWLDDTGFRCALRVE